MTNTTTYGTKNYWLLLPAAGALLFVVLYVVASLVYPGGSLADKWARGFSWVHNYWCNLMNERAVNGELNPARPTALVAMGVLCVTMASFGFLFPTQVPFRRNWRILLQAAGVGSMVLALFIFTEQHDLLINLSCGLGLVGVAGTMVGLWKLKWKGLFWTGVLNLLMVGVNNWLYYGGALTWALPVVQKITFLLFLGWITIISWKLYKKVSLREQQRSRRPTY